MGAKGPKVAKVARWGVPKCHHFGVISNSIPDPNTKRAPLGRNWGHLGTPKKGSQSGTPAGHGLGPHIWPPGQHVDPRRGWRQISILDHFIHFGQDRKWVNLGSKYGHGRSRGYLPMDPQIRGFGISPDTQTLHPNIYSPQVKTCQVPEGSWMGLVGSCWTCQNRGILGPLKWTPWGHLGDPKYDPFWRTYSDASLRC